MKYKLQGPFKPWRSEIASWYVLDGAGLCCLKAIAPDATETGSKAICNRIAAALNRDEARKAKPTNQWGTSCKRDGWNFDVYFGGELVDLADVVQLLNKLGAKLPKRKPARKGER